MSLRLLYLIVLQRVLPPSHSPARRVRRGCVDNLRKSFRRPGAAPTAAARVGCAGRRVEGLGLGPASLHEIPVSPHDRGWGDNPMSSVCSRPQPDQRRKHRPIRPGQSRPTDLAANTANLVAQHEDLRIFRVCAAGQQPQPARPSSRPRTGRRCPRSRTGGRRSTSPAHSAHCLP
jgi:hypothetical protein